MSSRPLQVFVVAKERELLRHLSRFLREFGYRVVQARDVSQARHGLEAATPDVLILDAAILRDGGDELCEVARANQQHPDPYVMLLTGRLSPGDLEPALHSGVDDFLQYPLVYGEILARLRAAARTVEFRRRRLQQQVIDGLTGLLSRAAFVERIQEHLAPVATTGQVSPRSAASCVLVDLDFFHRINDRFGHAAGDEVLQAVADRLGSMCDAAASIARLSDDRFAVLLPGVGTAQAVTWAGQMGEQIASVTWPVDDDTVRITASFGVVGCQAGSQSSGELLDSAQQALGEAKASGRGCVVQFGQFESESIRWAELAAPGKLFERAVARDVMTPCTLTLSPEDTVGRANALFRKTRVSAIPVVDADGATVGMVLDDERMDGAPDGAGSTDRAPIQSVMRTDVTPVDEEATFDALIACFAADPVSVVPVARKGQVTGLVTRDGLASLIKPVHSDSFAPELPYSAGTDYLAVADRAVREEV